MSKLQWSVRQPHTPANPTDDRIVVCHREVVGGVNFACHARLAGTPSYDGQDPADLEYIIQDLTGLLTSTSRLAQMRWYRAEVLGLGRDIEWREYRAPTLEAAATLAEEEFGAENIGRVIERR
ncbi:hypothetical protein C5022_000035 [Pseudomonas phage vB_PaeP_130_113]|uniref:Uncharacterized protein n=1 Tax=Pseudomonas phage vB_PaeP_130_113 TaxID=2161784 RepID=A0A2R4P9A8_9CAUD|nr:hypothetical protein HOT07_gp35 [Pseudomonas phage vB_PaeP_130_113]AVX47638.1 hypothetical protein C5022_000035 [Pseudomonas phage vB_PaeP_130_113]